MKRIRKLKVGVIQFSPESFNFKSNLSKALDLVTSALDQGARLVVVPELFDSGYCVQEKDHEIGINLKEEHPTLCALTALTQRYNAYIVACSIEKAENLYDSAYIVDKYGVAGVYKKIYLWGDEKNRFSKGSEYPIFELDFSNFKVKIGLQICYEIGFGEGFRLLALQGAELICCPAAFGQARSYVWDVAGRARALENGIFVLASNRSGSEFSRSSEKKLYFAGNSRIIHPNGKILKEILEKEGVIVCELNLDDAQAQRETIPYLRDLNVELVQNSLKKLISKRKE